MEKISVIYSILKINRKKTCKALNLSAWSGGFCNRMRKLIESISANDYSSRSNVYLSSYYITNNKCTIDYSLCIQFENVVRTTPSAIKYSNVHFITT